MWPSALRQIELRLVEQMWFSEQIGSHRIIANRCHRGERGILTSHSSRTVANNCVSAAAHPMKLTTERMRYLLPILLPSQVLSAIVSVGVVLTAVVLVTLSRSCRVFNLRKRNGSEHLLFRDARPKRFSQS